MKQDDVYKFTLLYRCSRDGNTVAKFRELCNDKGPTVAIGKVLGTGEILGGYNLISWGFEKSDFVTTAESFIFALDKNIDKNIVSFVDNSLFAICDHMGYFLFLEMAMIYFLEITIANLMLAKGHTRFQ